MSERVEKSGLQVDVALAAFIDGDVIAPLGIDPAAFWAGFAALLSRFVPVNRALLAKRDALQAQIDAWYSARAGKPIDAAEYQAFLREIGYLVPEPAPFQIGTQNVDAEIATMAGPQLVVPVLNARFLLNAANSRWGSLYDAFYGTDALDAAPASDADSASLPVPVQELDIDGTEYTFTVSPDPAAGLKPGWTTVKFHNIGREAHQVMFARLKDGVDLAELAAAGAGDSSGAGAIAFVDMIGG